MLPNLVFDGPLLVADREGDRLDDLTDRLAGVSDAVHLAVGPEGGFTDNELAAKGKRRSFRIARAERAAR